jgi:acyl-CoA synthetase (AMP-forming)/AMP-acid ligase II
VHLDLVLEMAVSGHGERIAFGSRADGTGYEELAARVGRAATVVRARGTRHLVYVGTNGVVFALALFAASRAGVPLVPLNYRQGPDQLVALVAALDGPLLVHDADLAPLVAGTDAARLTTAELWELSGDDTTPQAEPVGDPESIALLLHTSGTTAAPKAAVLRHRHLAAYVMTTVEFSNAHPSDASLVSVPPYHIAGVSNTISNVYAGRRVVHLADFTPGEWLGVARREQVTHALVVPTMLARVVEHLDATGEPAPPSLRTLAYGGAPMPATVVERALTLLPDTDFVNAYGLTETSSTIAILGPEEHRQARASDDPGARARLGSAGTLVPGIEVEIRDPAGSVVGPGTVGELWVRGEQVSGEYAGRARAVDDDGWFPTRDRAWIDDSGYLFVEGRADDTIIRGGENIAPAEIEEALRRHDRVADVAVVGVPDDVWGQRIAAAVVARPGTEPSVDALQSWVRERLRGAKVPEEIRFVDELPVTATGKLLRREVAALFTA